MVTRQLLDYIKQQQALGKNRDEIVQVLLAAGWQARDIQQALTEPNMVVAEPALTATELPKAREILKEAWAVYKARFKTLIGISLIPVAVYVVLGLLGGGIYWATKQAGINFQGLTLVIIAIVGLVAFLFLIYVGLWSTVAQLFAIKDQAEGIGWKEAFVRSKNKIGPFFTTSLLVALAVLGGTILLIIPGIIFAFWFSQSAYIVIEEGLSGGTALKRSKYYVKARLGQVFKKGFYIGLIAIGLYILLGILIGILNSFTGLNPDYTSWISNILSIFVTPLVTVYAYLFYKHLKTSRP